MAVPVASGGAVYGAVRVTTPASTLDDTVRRTRWGLVGLGGGVLLTMALAGFAVAGSVTRPVRELERATAAIARGELSRRVKARSGPPELRALGREFNVMATRTEQLVEAQRRFVADASHQLRTPLTALTLRLETLAAEASADAQAPSENGDRPEATRASSAEAALAEAVRLSKVIDQLLALARAEGAKAARTTVDAAVVARERVETWRPLYEEQGVQLGLDVATSAPAVVLPGALDQVIDNLLSNALDAITAPGWVDVIVRRTGDLVDVHVVDNGPGMNAEDRERAFDRFWSKSNGSGGGSGLGLSIVLQLVEVCGGTVSFRDVRPHGLDAVVQLVASPERALERAPLAPERINGPGGPR